MGNKVRLAIVGLGAVSEANHFPGIQLDPRAELVCICDEDPQRLRRRQQEWDVPKATSDYRRVAADPDVDAVIVATPNYTHLPITLACVEQGKHVLCEKPLGLNFEEARRMYQAARQAGVRHMTAFTYRFAPSMRYLKHLVKSGMLGQPRHFRSQRFLDWPETSWGWRQYKKLAGAGDLFDMTIHRIDFAADLLGPIRSICGAVAQFARRDRTADGRSCEPSDVDDWSALIGLFECGAVGVWEGSTLMKGYHNGGLGYEWAEVNGSEASAVYQLSDPHHIWIGRHGGNLERKPVPPQFLVVPGSPRNPAQGHPTQVFRYDQVFEFVSAILEGRDPVPSFRDGAAAQAVADAVLQSFAHRRWVDINVSLD